MHVTMHYGVLKMWSWHDTLNKLQTNEPNKNLWMYPLGNMLTIHPIHTGWECTCDQYLRWRCGSIDNLDSELGNGLFWNRTQTWRDVQEQLWTLCPGLRVTSWAAVTIWPLPWSLDAVFSKQCLFGTFYTYKPFCYSLSSLLQSEDSRHHIMEFIIVVFQYIFKRSS